MALRKKDQPMATKVGNDYISSLNDRFTKENLGFIKHITRSSQDLGFKIFQSNYQEINLIMNDPYMAQNQVMDIIQRENLPNQDARKSTDVNWELVERSVSEKYGDMGRERVLGERMTYYLDHQDWANFGKYFSLYFGRDELAPRYAVNNICWPLFEHIDDKKILSIAIKAMEKYEMLDGSNVYALDTYANLLYKVGRKEDAILWEEKALKMDPNSEWKRSALEKMKRGENTWPDENKK
jgi:tetratricopeptide (TPR) repeat protein